MMGPHATKSADLFHGSIEREITLVEASAGTGKTYSISHRVLRLLLEERISIREVLVVTFTRAATRELRDRIRKVIVEARELLERSLEGEAIERAPEVIGRVLSLGEAERRQALVDAKRALDELDLASVHTIHGFCERALSLHALELGYDTSNEIATNVDGAREAVVHDLFVQRVAGASPAERRFLEDIGYAPRELAKLAKSVWALRGTELADREAPRMTIDELAARAEAWCRAIGEGAEEIAGAMAPRLVQHSRAKKQDSISKSLERACRDAARAFEGLSAYDVFRTLLRPSDWKAKLKNVYPPVLEGWVRPNESVDHPTLRELERLVEAAHSIANEPFRELAEALPERLEEELARRGELSFEQMIGALHRVVSDRAGAARLRATLGARYRAVLIDEFQDTDEAQWAIFHALFGRGAVLDLVGDPKQAIYGFRGADIHAYAAAKEQKQAFATMKTNQRSDARYVAAMNALFGVGAPPSEGEEVLSLGSDEIAYVGVTHAARNEESRLESEGRAPSRLVRVGDEAKGATRQTLVAEEVVRLLNEGATISDEGSPRPVRPGDVAILCRTARLGRFIAEELRARGVPCVTSRSENVWTSEAAALLDGLLTAALHPHDSGALRAVAVDRLFGLTATELDDREGLLSETRALVREVAGQLDERGIAAAVVHLLASPFGAEGESVAALLLSRLGGERLVTDLRHLGELLHLEAVHENLGAEETLGRLRERRASTSDDQEYQQRLESDANSVNITTVHSSKGLEYPIVFLPDLDSDRLPKRTDHVIDFHDDEGRRRLDVGKHRPASSVALERAVLESRQESMRLLYVAFTRARCHTTAFFELRSSAACAPLMAVLFGGEATGVARLARAEERVSSAKSAEELEALASELEELAERSGGTVELTSASAPVRARYLPPEAPEATLAALAFPRERGIDYGYSDYSYTGLLHGAGHSLEVHGGDDEGGARGEREISTEYVELPLAQMKGGTGVGRFVHQVFEHLDFESGAPKDASRSAFDLAVDFASREGLESPVSLAELLAPALPGVLSTPLGGELGELSLSRVARRDRLDELDFLLAVDPGGSDWAKVGAVARAMGQPIDGLETRSVRGFLTGSIDLLFRIERDGEPRFYVADYKTNFLGPRLSDYAPERLERAMSEQRYWLQAAFYLLALDRFLADRLGASYDYETHCGGALYLFVRGMVGERARIDDERTHGVHWLTPSRAQMEALRAALGTGGGAR